MERVNEERGYLSFKKEIWFVLNEEREGVGFVWKRSKKKGKVKNKIIIIITTFI